MSGATKDSKHRTPRAGKPRTISQLKVTLQGIRPPVWRRILVQSDVTLAQLHIILQMVLGWTDSHLHQFVANGLSYGVCSPDDEWEVIDEKKVRLNRLLRAPGDRMLYEYDFGDGWEHLIVLEKVEAALPNGKYPMVLAGRRARPPEDVGGTWGYEEFLKAIGDPNHPEHESYLEWCGGSFDPEKFDTLEINLLFHGGWHPRKESGN
jgi:hypothetical protein